MLLGSHASEAWRKEPSFSVLSHTLPPNTSTHHSQESLRDAQSCSTTEYEVTEEMTCIKLPCAKSAIEPVLSPCYSRWLLGWPKSQAKISPSICHTRSFFNWRGQELNLGHPLAKRVHVLALTTFRHFADFSINWAVLLTLLHLSVSLYATTSRHCVGRNIINK